MLGVASATNNPTVVLVAGLAATFAETISMTAIAYTSKKAERDYYESERAREEWEIKFVPDKEKEEIRELYANKGFKEKLLNEIVKVITSNKKVWVDTMMTEELNLSSRFDESPLKTSLIVLIATLIGSLITLAPFALFNLLSVGQSMVISLILAVTVLYIVGVVKARLTVGNWFVSGLELAIIGTVAAGTGYFIGSGLGRLFGTNVVAG